MAINISSSPPIHSNHLQVNKATSLDTPHEAQQNFSDFLKNSISELNEVQQASSSITQSMARGEDVELHEVMITAQKANITLQTVLEVRNKAVEAYQEIMRMQV